MLAHLPLAWIVARAAGMVAFALLTFSSWLGLAMSTRILGTQRQKALLGWHRTLVWTGLSMLVLHAGALLLDPVLRFGLSSVLVPFASPWHPGAVAMGVIAAWFSLMLALCSRAALDRPARLATAALHELRRVRTRAHARAVRGHGLCRRQGVDIAVVALAPVLWLGFLRILEPRGSRRRPTAGPTARSAALQSA